MDYKGRLELSIKDMVYYILRRWRSVIACALIVAIIVGIYSYIPNKNVENKSGNDDDKADYSSESMNKLATRLSDSELDEVLILLQTYFDYKKSQSVNQNYVNNSIYNRLDSLSFPTYLISYAVSDYYGYDNEIQNNSTVMDNIVTIYEDALNGQDVVDEIRMAIGWSVEDVVDSYITELYSVSKVGLSMMQITIHAPTQDECALIAGVLKNKVDDAMASVKDAYSHSILKTSEYYYEYHSQGLADIQKGKTDNIAAIEKSMLSIKSSMTKIQQALFTKLLGVAEKYMDDSGIIDTESMLEGEGIVAESDYSDGLDVARRINWIYIIIGVLFGILIAVIWHALAYVLSTKLRTKADISGAFGLSVLGELKSNYSFNGLFGGVDRFIEGVFWKEYSTQTPEEHAKMIASSVAISAWKNDYRNICLTSVNSDENSASWREKIVDAKCAIDSMTGNTNFENSSSPLSNLNSMNKLVSADAVVLVEKVGATKYEDLAKMLELSSNLGIKILGTVLVY